MGMGMGEIETSDLRPRDLETGNCLFLLSYMPSSLSIQLIHSHPQVEKMQVPSVSEKCKCQVQV